MRGRAPSPSPLTIAPDHIAFAVSAGDVGERLDRFLGLAASERRLALSRTRLRALIEAGHVTVDGVAVRDPATRLTEGALIEVAPPPAVESTLLAQALPLDIVFEDAHLLVLDKPAGLVVHPAAGHEDGTLVNALIAHCGDSLSGIGGIRRPGIVHRLDKDTSGLLAVAKTDAAHQGLSALFADHGRTGSLVREYQALAWGTPEAPSGTIDAPLGRHPRQREKRAVAPPSTGGPRSPIGGFRNGLGRSVSSPAAWRPAAPIRFASISRISAIRSSATRSMARGSRARPRNCRPTGAPPSRGSAARRCTPRSWGSPIRSLAKSCSSRARRQTIFCSFSTP